MKKKLREGMYIKNIMILLVTFICLLISGCGDSSKDQIIVISF